MFRYPWRGLFALFSSAVLILGCEPTPCLRPPVSTLGIAFFRDSAGEKFSKPFPAKGLFLKQGNRVMDARELLGRDPGTATFERIQFPFPNLRPDFEIGWASDSLKDSLRFMAEPTLLYGGESCGFYEGFQNLSLRSYGGSRIRRTALNAFSGDTSQKIHVEVYW